MDEQRRLRLLHLEDDANDIFLVERGLARAGLACDWRVVGSRAEFIEALAREPFDAVMSDAQVRDLDGLAALQLARQHQPDVPFIFVSGHGADPRFVDRALAHGATACVSKDDLPRVVEALREVLAQRAPPPPPPPGERYLRGMERLVLAVQELSLARDLDTVMAVVRRAARELTGADGATFILRDGEQCHYVDEDAIAPLWKGRRFPLTACISGWAMLNRQPAVIEDIYADERIPHEAYRPTFVKSLAMVPVRTLDPIAAIGNYWAQRHAPTRDEVRLLQALADTTAVAMENVRVYAELEQRVERRTAELHLALREIEAFSAAVSHDLRAPLRHIVGFAKLLEADQGSILDAGGRDHLRRIIAGGSRMNQLIDDLLMLSRTTRSTLQRSHVDLGALAREALEALRRAEPGRAVELHVADDLCADGDPRLLRVALENLISNAWKFSAGRQPARIEIGSERRDDGRTHFYVRDNGAGFDMVNAGRLFGVFQRLHTESEFPGTGIGLATVQRVIQKHGGEVWADGAVDRGATFYFWLPSRTDDAPA